VSPDRKWRALCHGGRQFHSEKPRTLSVIWRNNGVSSLCELVPNCDTCNVKMFSVLIHVVSVISIRISVFFFSSHGACRSSVSASQHDIDGMIPLKTKAVLQVL